MVEQEGIETADQPGEPGGGPDGEQGAGHRGSPRLDAATGLIDRDVQGGRVDRGESLASSRAVPLGASGPDDPMTTDTPRSIAARVLSRSAWWEV